MQVIREALKQVPPLKRLLEERSKLQQENQAQREYIGQLHALVERQKTEIAELRGAVPELTDADYKVTLLESFY